MVILCDVQGLDARLLSGPPLSRVITNVPIFDAQFVFLALAKLLEDNGN